MIDRTLHTRNQDASQEEIDRLLGEIATEFFERISQGELPRIEEYTQRHPELADMIRRALNALQVVGDSVAEGKTRIFASGTGGEAVPPNGKEKDKEKQLGDFRILHELGRGGMGVVYEAEQISMGDRRVALKVLPFAAMADPRQRQRFQNEVRAAASLDHPNIVSVYSVGEDRGVHFYAMRLIRGQSMSQLIHELAEARQQAPLSAESVKQALSSPSVPHSSSGNTDPTEALAHGLNEESNEARSADQRDTAAHPQALISTKGSAKRSDYYKAVADLAIQAAEALEHAHQRGVIHRDIKPANLMIDAYSQLYITDFGLAHIEEGIGMTMTGDLIGTLRYMSPEQALAKRVMIGHRSDIYSLGMTLYEFLTLQPAFTASDRQELLKQIAFEDPSRPRQRDRSIPAELETIVLKAIEKNPEDRYATAGEMADDLRAFLEDRPIQAKRPTLTQRTVKWNRRHRTLVNTAVATLAIAIAIGGELLWHERSKTLAALGQATAQQQLVQSQAEQLRSSQAEAIRQRDHARWNQYCAETVSGQVDYQRGQVDRLEQKLLRQLPISGWEDHRGWEWYYLFSLCHPEVRALDGWGHNATWSPDGAYLAACGLIYDGETGSCVRRLEPSINVKMRGNWSPDSKMYAWAMSADDNCIYIWNRDSDELAELRGHEDTIICLNWSPDGKHLASGGYDREVWIWDIAARGPIPKLKHRQRKYRDFVTGLAWSPDGEVLAAGSKWNRLMVWNPNTGEILVELDGLGTGESLVDRESNSVDPVWHPSGDRLAVATSECWLIMRRSDWSVINQQKRQQGQERFFSIAWRPDGKRIAQAHDGSVTILDPSDDKVLPVTYENLGSINHIAWSPDARKLATTEVRRRNQQIKIWELNSPFQPPVISGGGAIESLSWLPNSDALVAVNEIDRSISFWRIIDGERLRVEQPPVADRVSWSPDRRLAAVLLNGTPQKIQVLDGTSGSVHSVWQSSDATDQINGFSWSLDGTKLAISMNRGRTTKVEFWRIDDEKSMSLWAHNTLDLIHDIEMVWSPDGSRIAASSIGEFGDNGTPITQGHIYVVDVSRGVTLLKHNLAGWEDKSRVKSLAWSPDGRTIVAGNYNGLIEAVDVESGQVRFSNRVSSTVIHDLAYSPDGLRIVSAAEDGIVKVFGATAGDDLLQFQLAGGAHHVSWSPNGKRLAAATGDGSIHIWDGTRAFEFSDRGRRRDELARAYYRSLTRLESLEDRERLREVLKLAPDTLGNWELRGHAYAKLGEFEKASQEFSKAIGPGLDRSCLAAINYGYALLGTGEVKAFREYSKSLLSAFEDVESRSTGREAAWLCALREIDSLDAKTIVRLSRSDVNARNQSYDQKRILGAALYRDGQYQQAAETLTEVADQLEAMSDPSQAGFLASTLYFLAMTRRQLGHHHQALRILSDANRISSKVDANGNWKDAIELKVLSAQAMEMIGQTSH